jgi:hypothetical protein
MIPGVELMSFDLITSTGVLFTYSVRIPDRATMQMLEFTIHSPFTDGANIVTMNVASLALIGKSVEQTLVEHVEFYEKPANRGRAADT